MKFLRRTSNRYSKLGKKRKKKQIWRRPTGRDNKMRDRRRGYPARVEIGYKQEKKQEKEIAIRTLKDLEKVNEGKKISLGKVGIKKKLELLKKAKEKKLIVQKINIEKFLEKNKKIPKIQKKAKEKIK
jgi:large subunit ribosomal protein L32e